jgi:hypothetical protein
MGKGDPSFLIRLSIGHIPTFLTIIDWVRVHPILWLSLPDISIRQPDTKGLHGYKLLEPSTPIALNNKHGAYICLVKKK